MVSSGSGYSPVMSFWEYGNEFSDLEKAGNILSSLDTSGLSKKEFVAWIKCSFKITNRQINTAPCNTKIILMSKQNMGSEYQTDQNTGL